MLGQKIESIRFFDAQDKTLALADLKGKKGTVVVFLSFECPVSVSYIEPLNQMAKKYADFRFVGVCPGAESSAQLATWVKEFKPSFPIVRDEKQAAVRAFQAETTPEVFLLDADRVLRYCGRIDDSYSARLKRSAVVAHHDLRDALDQCLAGKPIATQATTAIGCPIGPVERAPGAGKVTYYRDVLPIVQAHCQTCHRPGASAPFSLLTFKQAVNWADDIKTYTQSRKMPPWLPTDGVPFKNERKLTKAQIDTLAAWVDGGMPAGAASDAPKPLSFKEGWQLGEPDLIVTPDKDMTVGATGPDLFRAYVLPTNLTEDKFVSAYEFRPGNTRVVHHALHFFDTTGAARRLLKKEEDRSKRDDEADRGPGYTSRMRLPGFLPQGDVGGWAPGQQAHFNPAGVGYFLPKGSDLVLQVHYHRNGREETDRPQLGRYVSQKPVKAIQPIIVPGWLTSIPAGDAGHKVKGAVWVDRDCTIFSVTPHMHLLGKKMKVAMTPPGGEPTTLINIDDWDFNWQENYFFKEPIAVKAGTKFSVEAVYDNSEKNPSNPSQPPKRVWVGEGTTNEMCFGFLDAASNDDDVIRFRLSPQGVAIRPIRTLPSK